jgi:S-formylglutathione hydrolase FrmB
MRTRAALTGALIVLCLVPAAAARAAAPAVGDGQGLHVVAAAQLDPRLVDVTVSTPALAKPVHVRILVPAGYAAQTTRRYPVLYLLHGALDDYRSWSDKGAAEQITAGAPLIVVMPEGGNGGWYTNWFNGAAGGPPEWERFHIDQLIPWLDAHYRTIATRTGRAVAGLSMGGFGAMSYAARHPGLFVFAGSYSGAVDIVNNAPVAAVIGFEAPADGGKPGDQFGDRVVNESVWRAHNPWDQAARLRGLVLTVHTGNGQPGPYDDRGRPLDLIEQQVREMSLSFHRRLVALGIPHRWDDYGGGTHSWPYWQRDLREDLPSMMATFAHPPPAPAPGAGCRTRRRFVVRLPRRPGLVIGSVVLRVNGRRAASLTGNRRTVAVDLRRRRAGTYHVTIAVRGVRRGHRVALTVRRTYRTC